MLLSIRSVWHHVAYEGAQVATLSERRVYSVTTEGAQVATLSERRVCTSERLKERSFSVFSEHASTEDRLSRGRAKRSARSLDASLACCDVGAIARPAARRERKRSEDGAQKGRRATRAQKKRETERMKERRNTLPERRMCCDRSE